MLWHKSTDIDVICRVAGSSPRHRSTDQHKGLVNGLFREIEPAMVSISTDLAPILEVQMEQQPWTDADDQALLARVVGGDREALEALYRVHAGWLTARLQQRCAQPELVDSALQDTFVAVWKSAKKYKRKGPVAAWIWGIAVRRLIDLTRKRRPTPMDLLPSRATPTSSAEQALMDSSLGGELGAAFATLDSDLQAVLIATAVDGLSTKEAGQLLGIPQGTVKTRLMRAREQMREQLS